MSTPIETNTEQLQEVLQQVYDLPSRSGGSGYDLTIQIDNWDATVACALTTLTPENISVSDAEVLATAAKLGSNQPVEVRLVGYYSYWSSGTHGTIRPVLVNGYNAAVFCEFIYHNTGGELYVTTISIYCDTGTNTVRDLTVTHNPVKASAT